MRVVGFEAGKKGILIWPGESDSEGDVGLQFVFEEDGVRIHVNDGDAGPFAPAELQEIGRRMIEEAEKLMPVVESFMDLGKEPETEVVADVWTAERLSDLRKSRFTQPILAKELGVSLSTYRKLEKGESPISPEESAKLTALESDSGE